MAGFVQGVGHATGSWSVSKCARRPKPRAVVRSVAALDDSNAVNLYLPDDTYTEALGAFLALDAQVCFVLTSRDPSSVGYDVVTKGHAAGY